MNVITRTTPVAALVALSLALLTRAAEPPKLAAPTDLDKLVGQPVDLAPCACAWRADRQVQGEPEAYFIPRRLERLDKVCRTIESRPTETDQDRKRVAEYKRMGLLPAPSSRLLSALLWLAPVPAQRIELRWPEASCAAGIGPGRHLLPTVGDRPGSEPLGDLVLRFHGRREQ